MANTVVERSEQLYEFLLKLYPENFRQEFAEEMQFIFSEQLKETYGLKGNVGILHIWLRTSIDFCKSLMTQHIEQQKGNRSMKQNKSDIMMSNAIFGWIAVTTLGVLTVPFLAMQFSNEVNWGVFDFVIIGVLLFGAGSTFVLVARKVPQKNHRVLLALGFLAAVLYIWAELAVGIFTNLGS